MVAHIAERIGECQPQFWQETQNRDANTQSPALQRFSFYNSIVGAFTKIGLAMKRLRKARGVPLAELAMKMGYSDPSSAKSLEVRNPTASNLGRYLDALGCDVHDLADALDAVNQRGRYAPEFMATVSHVAEGSPEPYIRSANEAIGSLTLQLMQLKAELERERKLKDTTR